ncbi:MAG: PAS domain S-box protein [Prolixibacteraceae bacterium]|nr:PAS domain S-box protein [Prolixibacteraceae bacterium]
MNQTRSKIQKLTFLLTSLLLLCINTVAQTDSLVTVGIYQNPPKIFLDENKKPAGIFVELLEEIARLENWQLNYVSCTWNDCMKSLENGDIDLLPNVAFTFDRMQQIDFNRVPVIEGWSQVYANPKSTIIRLADLDGKNIVLTESSVQQSMFNLIMNGFRYQFHELSATSYPDAFAMVKTGVADAAIVNNYFGDTYYKDYGLIKTPLIFSPTILHFTVKKGENTWIIEAIDEHLEKWRQTPESFFYQTLEKYARPSEIAEKPHTHLNYLLLIYGIILTGILLFLFFHRRLTRKTRELVKAAKKLNYEEQKFRNYIEHAPYGVFVADEAGKYIDVNPAACELTGYSPEEIIGKNIGDIIADEGKKAALKHYKTVVNKGKSTAIIPYVTKKGEKRLWKIIATSVSPKRFIGFVDDITEEVETRNRLNMMSEIFDQSVNEIYLFDAGDYHFVQVNEAAVKNTGYASWELQKMTPFDLKINLSVEQFDALIQSLLRKEKNSAIVETPHYRKDGSFYFAEVYLQFLEKENLFLTVVLDITDRKNKEKELQQVQKKLKKKVAEKTKDLNERITELENFREATIERELRMEELRKEIEQLKNEKK